MRTLFLFENSAHHTSRPLATQDQRHHSPAKRTNFGGNVYQRKHPPHDACRCGINTDGHRPAPEERDENSQKVQGSGAFLHGSRRAHVDQEHVNAEIQAHMGAARTDIPSKTQDRFLSAPPSTDLLVRLPCDGRLWKLTCGHAFASVRLGGVSQH